MKQFFDSFSAEEYLAAYKKVFQRWAEEEKRHRRRERWELLMVILLAVLLATPWCFAMACLAVKVVTG